MSEQPVLYSEDGAVAVISLNRPEAMNASNRALRAALSDAMDRAEMNRDIRVVILTGEGRGFSAGADLSEPFTEFRGTVGEHILKDHARLIDNIVHSDKAYVAALPGATAGVGLAYALACDQIVMAEDALLYAAFAAIGLVPDGGASWQLCRAFGYHRAFGIIAGMHRATAQDCLSAGLAASVVPVADLRSAAQEQARHLASAPAPISLKFIKKLLRRAET